jgi:hypothetical protein
VSVTVQKAAINALAEWLGQKMPDVSVTTGWPSPDKELPAKAITVLLAGSRRDEPMDLRQLSHANSGANQSSVVWSVCACVQPVQLDVWALSDFVRDDILARLDGFLHAGESALDGVFNPDPVGNTVLLTVNDGWESCGTTADFHFDSFNLEDNPSAAATAQYRATARGDAYFMLALTTLTARQKVIKFRLQLSETGTGDGLPDADTTTYTTSA